MDKLGEILQELTKTIQEKQQAGSLPTREPIDPSIYFCQLCKDTRFIFYRIHSDVRPHELNEKTGMPHDPSKVITEDYFYSGKIHPSDANKWLGKLGAPCSCVEIRKQKKQMEQIMGTSNLSPKFKKRTFDTISWLNPADFNSTWRPEVEKLMSYQRKAYDVALAYVINFDESKAKGQGIGFLGDYGTAKTHLLAAVVNYLTARGVQAVHVNTQELLEEIRSTYETDKDGKPTQKIRASEIIALVKSYEYLSLDDIGTEKPTPWVQEKFYEILNFRYENELSTSFSTNNTPEELQLHLGKSYRRLMEPCFGRCVEIKGMSFELLKLQQGRK